MNKHTLTVILLLTLISFGCSTSNIISSWTQPGMTTKAYEKILVLGLINEPDRSIREKLEKHLAEDLRALGYAVVCACEEFQPNTFYGLTEAQMLEQMEENSFDAVITIVLLSKQKEKRLKSGQPGAMPPNNYRRLWSYYQYAYDLVSQPEYYTESVSYFWETNFYDLGSHSILYSAQSQSFDPASTTNLAHEFGLLIVKDMIRKNVVSNQVKTLKYF